MLVSLALPSGLFRNGTPYQARGRWAQAELVRWFSGEMRPMGGWSAHALNTFSNPARTLLTWRDNNASIWAAFGTADDLYVMSRSGLITAVTPAGFTPGNVDAVDGGGYGVGAYGAGTYGTIRPDGAIQDATQWSLDTWGPYLVGVSPDDARLCQWTLNPATPAAVIANSPSAKALVVTNEHFLFALGCGGDERQIAWPDQSDNTLWTPDVTNSAGSETLPSTGRILCGRRLAQGTGIWTDNELWIAQYIGQPDVYGFQKADSGCGALSRNAVVSVASQAFWMGPSGFFAYNGFVAPLPCDVQDYVYANLNPLQVSKISAFRLAPYREVWWLYPSQASTECDSYVTYNYQEGHWNCGTLSRTAGADQDVFSSPMMCGTDGTVYDHETGFNYGGLQPMAESGPFALPGALAEGDRTFRADLLIADETTTGALQATFYAAWYPNTAETSYGPFGLSTSPTPVRFSGRQARVLVQGEGTPQDWRWGAPRLNVTPGGGR